jgi:hypothetical protein
MERFLVAVSVALTGLTIAFGIAIGLRIAPLTTVAIFGFCLLFVIVYFGWE